MAVDGRTVTALTRDLRRRTVRTLDYTDTTRNDGVGNPVPMGQQPLRIRW